MLDGQTVVIEDYLAIRPEAQDRVRRAIARGQIQVGPWYTLPDEFLVSGETVVRNLERGLAVGDAHGGSMRVGYLPDSFGHAAQMPQIYGQFGLSHAVIWRGAPSSIDRVAFTWEAPDGTSILTAYMATSYSHGRDLPLAGAELADRVRRAVADLKPFVPGADVLLMNGNDHVSPQPGLTGALTDANRYLDGIYARVARLDEYLERLPTGDWPRWKGELRASARANVLMGTLSVRAPDKQAYFLATQDLERRAEPLAALTGVPADGFLREAWTMVLQNAAHDTACGSGIDAVAAEARVRSESVRQIAAAVTARAFARLAEEAATAPAPADEFEAVVWNPSPYRRSGLVVCALPADRRDWVAETSEGIAATQRLEDAAGAHLVPTGLVPGCSWARVRMRPGQAPPVHDPVRCGPDGFENGELTCGFQPDGRLRVRHRSSATQYVDLNQFVDEGDAGDEYNYSPAAQDTAITLPKRVAGVHWLETGPCRGTAEVRILYRIPASLVPDRRRRAVELVDLPIMLRVSMQAGSPQLDVEVELENQARDHRLRVLFPLPYDVSHSDADGAYSVTRRPAAPARLEPGASEWELPTYPMRTFVDASDGTRGLAVISEGLHEYELIARRPAVLALTLLRAVGWLSRDDLSYRHGHAGPGLETPGAQVLGRHRLRYSLRFHQDGWEAAGLWRAAESTRLPVELVQLRPGVGRPERAAPKIEVEPQSIQMTACIPSVGGYVLRLLNASDANQDARVVLHPQPASVQRTTLAALTGEVLQPSGGVFALSFRRWEIATLRVVRA